MKGDGWKEEVGGLNLGWRDWGVGAKKEGGSEGE